MNQADRFKVRDALLHKLAGPRVLVMGILNVTPDSFSDGGRFDRTEAALAQAGRMREDGADILDIGGESTRPGALEVGGEEEWQRVEGAVRALASADGLPVSIDTYKASVARRAAEAGAVMINDVWGLTRDPEIADVVAETGSLAVITYNRGTADPALDLRADMAAFVVESFARTDRAGIPRAHILFDPGIGFGKTYEQNLAALAHLDVLVETGCPVLVGVSRKSFIGKLTGRPVGERLAGTLAAGLDSVHRGARVLRVHDVAEHRDAVDMMTAIREQE
jgi:dihydropteroate synthase